MAIGLKLPTIKRLFRTLSLASGSVEVVNFSSRHHLKSLIGTDEIELLMKKEIFTEYEDKEIILVESEPMPLFVHHMTGRLFYYTEEDGPVYPEREDRLHYRLNISRLVELLPRLLEQTETVKPLVRIPSKLWQVGRISFQGRQIPVWYCCSIARDYETVCEVLRKFKRPEMGLMLTNHAVDTPYQSLPGIQSVLVLDDVFDEWGESPRIDTELLSHSLVQDSRGSRHEPFLMPPNDAYILLKRTGEKYKLRGEKRKKFFRFIFEEGENFSYQVSFKKALLAAGYEDEYSSVKSLFKKESPLRSIVRNQGDVLELLEVPEKI